MKKIFGITMIAASLALMCACGPSQKELNAQKTADSIKIADSIKNVRKQIVADSITKVQANQKRIADSIANVKSAKHHKVHKTKKVKK
jgi:ABC-type phosphate/phosphonate transport system substrate-binding protein